MRIVLLGTSSAVPTLTRGLSSTALVRDGDVFLFDCGEGTQLQLMRSSVKRSRIHSIGRHHGQGYRIGEKFGQRELAVIHLGALSDRGGNRLGHALN